MAFIILVLMVFFAMIALQQQMTKKSVDAGAKDSEIKMILSYYRLLRADLSCGTDMTPWLCGSSTIRARAEKEPRSWKCR